MSERGVLMVISGPSGVGKGTVINRLFEMDKNCFFSVSATTREPRPGEVNGVHYRFMSRLEFGDMVKNGEMLEYDEHFGNFYGTPRAQVEKELSAGHNVILDIEYRGMRQIRESLPEMVSVLIAPPSVLELKRRLCERGTECESSINERLARARSELSVLKEYDYVIINDEIDEAAKKLATILTAARYRPVAMGKAIDKLLMEENENA